MYASEKSEQSHLLSPAAAPLIDATTILYVEDYLLIHGTDSVLELGEKGSEKEKVG